MRLFSWTCAKTGLPILNSTSWGERPAAYHVLLLTKDGRRVEGDYDGYGRLHSNVGTVDLEALVNRLEAGEAKLVLTEFYSGEAFDALGQSHNEPGQGHFWKDEDIEKLYAAGTVVSPQVLSAIAHGSVSAEAGLKYGKTVETLIGMTKLAVKRLGKKLEDALVSQGIALDHEHDRKFSISMWPPRMAFHEDGKGGMTVAIITKDGDDLDDPSTLEVIASILPNGDLHLHSTGQPGEVVLSFDENGNASFYSGAMADLVDRMVAPFDAGFRHVGTVRLQAPDQTHCGEILVWRTPTNEVVWITQGEDTPPMAHAYPGRALKRFNVAQTNDLFEAVYRCGKADQAEVEVIVLEVTPKGWSPSSSPMPQ